MPTISYKGVIKLAYDGSLKFDTQIDNGKFESTISKMKSTAIKSAAAIGAGFTAAAGYAINLASDLQEVQNVVDVTFGKDAAVIDSWAKSAATAFGLSELNAKQFNGTMGAMLKSMGISQSAVLEMSTSLTGLAADFASFYNLNHEEAFAKIRAGISGETEPLKQLGINMSVANLEAYALSQGIKENYKDMTQAEQATLRYNYLLHAGADAQGDFSRTSDSLANQLKIAQLNISDLAAEFGNSLLPIANEGIGVFSDSITELKTAIGSDEVKSAIESTGKLITGLITVTAELATDVLPPTVKVLGFFGDNLKEITYIGAAALVTFKSYSAVSAITGIINANNAALTAHKTAISAAAIANTAYTGQLTIGQTVIGVLTGKIKLAAAAQGVWNAVTSANPVGLAIAGVVALTAAIAGLVIWANQETEAEKAQREAIEANNEAIQNITKTYNDYKNSRSESTAQSLAEISHTQTLSNELMKLCDSTGYVNEANRTRAQFILNELNDALGTEYSMTNGIIGNYSKLKSSIYEVIEAKKLEILMKQAEEDYANSIKNIAEAEKAYAEAAKNNRSINNEETRAALTEAQELLEKYAADQIAYQEASSLALEGSTAEAIKYLEKHNEAYSNAKSAAEQYADGTAEKVNALKTEFENNLSILSEYISQYDKTGSAAAKSLVDKYIEKVIASKEDYIAAGGHVGNDFIAGLNGTEVDFTQLKENIELQLKGISTFASDFWLNSSAQSNQTGTNFSVGYALGIESGASSASEASEFLVKSALDSAAEAQDSNSPAKETIKLGCYFSEGLALGIKDGKSKVINAAVSVSRASITATKKELGIHSPARVPKEEIGKYISLGIAEGITENSDEVVKAFKSSLELLDYQRKFDIVNEEQYYEELEKLRDKYFQVGSKEWLDYTVKIYQYQQNLAETQKKEVEDIYDEITDYANKKLDEVEKKQQSMRDKMLDNSDEFSVSTIQFGDEKYTSLHDFTTDNKKLKEYSKLLEETKNRFSTLDIDEGIFDYMFSELEKMDIDKAVTFLNTLNKANDYEFNKWLSGYLENYTLSNDLSKNYYAEDMQKATEESYQNMVDRLNEAGFEVAEGFFVSGTISAEQFGNAFLEELEVKLSQIRNRIEAFNASLKGSISSSIKISGNAGNTYKYNTTNTYTVNASEGESTVDALKRQETIKRMAGV